MSSRGKYFNLQFNRERAGEAEFEKKLRKMAKDNNLTLTDAVMMLVLAVDQFKISYNVNVNLASERGELFQKPEVKTGSSLHFETKSEPTEVQAARSILDVLKDKR